MRRQMNSPARNECRIRLIHPQPYAPNRKLLEGLWWFFKQKDALERTPPNPGRLQGRNRSVPRQYQQLAR